MEPLSASFGLFQCFQSYSVASSPQIAKSQLRNLPLPPPYPLFTSQGYFKVHHFSLFPPQCPEAAIPCSLVLGEGHVNPPTFALTFLPPILLTAARTFFNIFDHSHLSSYPLKSTNSFPRLDYKDRGPKQGHPSVRGFPLSCLPDSSLFMSDIP